MIRIRWMIRRDLAEVLAIDAHNPIPWGEERFIDVLRQRNVIGMVIIESPYAMQEDLGSVRGFFIYGWRKQTMQLLNIGIDPTHRRKGLGTAIVDKLKSKLSERKLIVDVPETDLAMQLFLKANGLMATMHDNEHYRFRFKHVHEPDHIG